MTRLSPIRAVLGSDLGVSSGNTHANSNSIGISSACDKAFVGMSPSLRMGDMPSDAGLIPCSIPQVLLESVPPLYLANPQLTRCQ